MRFSFTLSDLRWLAVGLLFLGLAFDLLWEHQGKRALHRRILPLLVIQFTSIVCFAMFALVLVVAFALWMLE